MQESGILWHLDLPSATSSWSSQMAQELEQPYIQKLAGFLENEQQSGKRIYPLEQERFAAFELTPFDKVKVVILGQDPYHGPGQAHGLSFSVKPGVALPPSLRNIYRELADDLGITPPKHGHLEAWAQQGVLLLNSVLTVEDGRPGSHAKKGWERLTDKAITLLNAHRQGIVFILWGAYAHKKAEMIDSQKHCILASAHPSPLSARRGFFGSRPFSNANRYLESIGQTPIDWRLPL